MRDSARWAGSANAANGDAKYSFRAGEYRWEVMGAHGRSRNPLGCGDGRAVWARCHGWRWAIIRRKASVATREELVESVGAL